MHRDFTKSNKHYINQNKIVLIILSAILVLGIVMLCVLGFKGGTEVSGYNTFSVRLGTTYQADKLDDYTDIIESNLNEQKANLISVQVTGEGSYTTLVVKFEGDVKDEFALTTWLSNDLVVSVSNISEVSHVSASLTGKDYIYTVAAGLIIVALATIFVAFRYNLACAITALGTSILGVALLLAFTVIFRLTINSSFLAINMITLLLILGENIMVFDSLEKERAKLKDKNDRSTQLTNTLNANAFRQKFMYCSIFAIALSTYCLVA